MATLRAVALLLNALLVTMWGWALMIEDPPRSFSIFLIRAALPATAIVNAATIILQARKAN